MRACRGRAHQTIRASRRQDATAQRRAHGMVGETGQVRRRQRQRCTASAGDWLATFMLPLVADAIRLVGCAAAVFPGHEPVALGIQSVPAPAALRPSPWRRHLRRRAGRVRRTETGPGTGAQVAATDVRRELVGAGARRRGADERATRGRLHHAYLLTGTRGIGRPPSRASLPASNCATGATATPAARARRAPTSTPALRRPARLRRGVEHGVDDMREILEQRALRPDRSAAQAHLIDEVHMSSRTPSTRC